MTDSTTIIILCGLIVFLILGLSIVGFSLLDLSKRVRNIEKALPDIPRRFKA